LTVLVKNAGERAGGENGRDRDFDLPAKLLLEAAWLRGTLCFHLRDGASGARVDQQPARDQKD